ncbi:MAG: dihydrolipoamide acetyltransferase family protein, partial [Ferruginibacter sp.]
MSLVDLVMPKLGESIMEATILKWHKKPGDKVAQDETVLDIATDKVDSEVPSIAEGTITEIFFNENDVVPIGTVIARINTAAGDIAAPTQAAATALAPKKEYEDAKVVEHIPYQPAVAHAAVVTSNGPRFYSPLVLNIAQSEGISMSELENIPGTGQDGRVSKKDILNYVANKTLGIDHMASVAPTANIAPSQNNEVAFEKNMPAVITSYSGNVEVIEMDRMRKLIAKHMVDSKQTSAHVTSFAECDVTNLVLWREKVKRDFEKREGEKITYTPLFVEAIVKSIKKYPWLSSSIDGDKIIIKKDLNIGMATALPNGNLIVPVIKNADQL